MQELRENLRRAGAMRDELIKETLVQAQKGHKDEAVTYKLQKVNSEITEINSKVCCKQLFFECIRSAIMIWLAFVELNSCVFLRLYRKYIWISYLT